MAVNSSIEQQLLKKLTELTEANLTNEQFGVSELARDMNMSRSNLHRKVISITKTSVSQFIRQHRLKRAMEMLQQTALTVSEVAYNVGFGSMTYFTKCFHDYYGFPPGEVGKRNLNEPGSGEQAIDTKQVKSGKRLKIALVLASLLVIISTTTLFLVFKPFSSGKNKLEKTIAVLPFTDYSPEEGNTYIINGLQEEILDKLEKIQDLKVKSRTDVEKYKDTRLSISQIAKELNVNYKLEGSGQKIGDNIRIRLQLIDADSGNHIWSKPFQKEFKSDNIFEIQKEVALYVAKDLKMIITPENEKVTNMSTENLTAHNLFMQGVDYLNLSQHIIVFDRARVELMKAKRLFEQAIKLDSTYADAYVRLGHIFGGKLYFLTPDMYLSDHYLDSSLIMANKALLYDDKNGWAYSLKSSYYLNKGLIKEADEAHKKADECISPGTDWLYFSGDFWRYISFDSYKALASYYKYREATPPYEDDISMLDALIVCFREMGYPEIAVKYAGEILKETNDSLRFFYNMLDIEMLTGNFKAAVDYALKAVKMDTIEVALGRLASIYTYLRDYSMAGKYLQLEKKPVRLYNYIVPDMVIGYLHLKYGHIKEADCYFENAIRLCMDEIKLNRINAQNFYSQFYLACIYAEQGEKGKAIKNLYYLKKRETNPLWLLIDLKQLPLLDNIRKEPEFAEVLKDVEAKYQKEHERTGKLIKEYEGEEQQ